jgi:hypothetical protein
MCMKSHYSGSFLKLFRLFSIFSILLLFSACVEQGLFSTVMEDSVEVRTLEDGQVVQPGDTIPLSLDWDPERVSPERLIVSLFNGKGELIGTELVFTNSEIEDTSRDDIVLPENLLADFYEVEFKIEEAGDVIRVERRQFIVMPSSFEIYSIQFEPEELLPGGEGLLDLRFSVPANADPWIRWSVDGKYISSGYVSEGIDSLIWKAPESVGYYKVLAELFPKEPPLNFGANESPYKAFVTVPVDTAQNQGRYEFGPENQFYSLLHFLGSSLDSGYRLNANEGKFLGERELDLVSSEVGYRFTSTSALEYDASLLPIQGGDFEPFTFMTRVMVTEPGIFLTMGPMKFSFESSAEDILLAVLSLQGQQSSIEIVSDQMMFLAFSVIPGSTGIEVRWFVDGIFISSDYFELTSSIPSGKTTLGSINGGFEGFLSELAVYTRNFTGVLDYDTSIFRRNYEAIYGPGLIYAEGFDSALFNERTLIDSQYVLQPNERLPLTPFPIYPGTFEIRLEIDGNELIMRVGNEAGDRYIDIIYAENQEPVLLSYTGSLLIALDDNLEINARVGELDTISIELQNAGEAEVAVDSILVIIAEESISEENQDLIRL